MKTLEEIRTIYIKRFPHLAHTKSIKHFAQAALMLVAPDGITASDLMKLAQTANGR